MTNDSHAVGAVGDLNVVYRVIMDVGASADVPVVILNVVERIEIGKHSVVCSRVYQYLVAIVIKHFDDDAAVVITLSLHSGDRNGVRERLTLTVGIIGREGEKEP